MKSIRTSIFGPLFNYLSSFLLALMFPTNCHKNHSCANQVKLITGHKQCRGAHCSQSCVKGNTPFETYFMTFRLPILHKKSIGFTSFQSLLQFFLTSTLYNGKLLFIWLTKKDNLMLLTNSRHLVKYQFECSKCKWNNSLRFSFQFQVKLVNLAQILNILCGAGVYLPNGLATP